MDRVFLGIVGGAVVMALATAPLLPALPGQAPNNAVRADEVRVANTLLAVKAGCYLFRADIPQAESVLFEERLQDAFGAVVRGAGGLRSVVIRNTTRQGAVVVTFHNGAKTPVGLAAGVSVAQASGTPVYIDAEVLKRSGTNMCADR